MIETEGEFIPPPEAPVFEPTWEEFQDALAYINKIRPIAEKAGICRIKPPADWQPPFAVDVDNFRFVPRVQRLNELEAQTRIKLNFLDSLAKFWELQGTPLKIPHVERKYLDLFNLRKIVQEEGAFELCCRERKWSKVAGRLNYALGKGIGSTLRQHYEKVLYPYDLFQEGITVDAEILKREEAAAAVARMKNGGGVDDDDDIKPMIDQESGEVEKMSPGDGSTEESPENGGMRRSSRRVMKEDPNLDPAVNSELRRLAFYGPGPKAAVADTNKLLKGGKLLQKKREDEEIDENGKKIKMTTRVKKPVSYVDMYHCSVCIRGDGEDCMLLCDGCDEAFHTYCLLPPLQDIPKGDWRCPKCVAKECNKPKDVYGFQQSRKEHSLHTFGEMADQFKLDYFNMPVHMVPTSTVEREFWRLVKSIEEDVNVEYGADIHAAEMGSGFPTKDTRDLFPDDEEYIEAAWNLNNLPVQSASVLRHINADISGMKIPWCYVGMCFSSFCWHIEDHWSYSINYLHWGEPKTWYGVPGAKAELLEECMKKNAPELFEQSPDLLHQLTTIMNPNILMAYGVPVVRTNQCAGEFVITFPRSYHAGFNQGYNFAEAVNFAPADWLPMGRSCIEHYRLLTRQCVFSHEELVCKMAANPDRLDLIMAAGVYKDMLVMVEHEKMWRKKLLERGTGEAEREAFELLPDDERQCCRCKTTCFLSAVTCTCDGKRISCIQHAESLCSCPASQHCLRYRYTLDELPAMLHRLKLRAEAFDNWALKVKTVLDEPEQEKKAELSELKEMIGEAKEKKFPDSPLLLSLQEAVSEAEKCASVANQLVSKKVRTRCRQSGESKYVAKLSLDELEAFNEQMITLPCRIPEAKLIGDLLQKVIDFQRDAQDALTEETPNSSRLEKLMEFGITLDVELPEIPKLKQVLQQARWLDEVRAALNDPTEVTLELMRKLIESGVGLSPHPACEKAMAELQELLTVSERWEEKARICLQARPRHVMATLEAIISEAKGIPAFLPNVTQLKDALKKAKEWTGRVDSVQTGEHFPYLDMLENLVNKGRPIPVRLDQLPQLESQVAAAKSWRERTARTFLKKNSTYSLVEVLSPRSDVGVYQSGKNRRKKMKEVEKEKGGLGSGGGGSTEGTNGWDIKIEEQRDPSTMVAVFKMAESQEIDSMQDLRLRNVEKHHKADLDVKYCICRKGPSGFMLQCELCKDWFHSSCVPLPKSANLKNKTCLAAAVQAARDLKFLCPLCLRSRRPRLETILSLLVSLQKLPVRLPEGEALQCLTERAMAWQDRARQALATDELASALAKLSMLSQRMVEQAAREKTEKIISAELMKAASNPELQGHLQVVQQTAFPGAPGPQPSPTAPVAVPPAGTTMFLDSDSSMQNVPSAEDTESDDTQSEPDSGGQQQPPVMSAEHAYSSASKSGIAGVSGVAPGTVGLLDSPRKQARKSPLLPRLACDGAGAPVLELSEAARLQLEQLMMEGDLLEVSLDETQHIWRILQACQPHDTHKILEFADVDIDFTKERIDREPLKKEKKKRKSDSMMDKQIMGMEKPKKKKMKIGKDGKPIKDKALKEEKKKRKKMKKNLKEGIGGGMMEKKRRKLLNLDENDDDNCAALKCIKPTGDINWVQCDRCEKWFHLLCVGLGEDEVSENEDYVCYSCKNPKPRGIPGPRGTKFPHLGGITIPAPPPPSSLSSHSSGLSTLYAPPSPPSMPPRPSMHHGLPQLAPPTSSITEAVMLPLSSLSSSQHKPTPSSISVAAAAAATTVVDVPAASEALSKPRNTMDDLLAAAEIMSQQQADIQARPSQQPTTHQQQLQSDDDDDEDDDDDDEEEEDEEEEEEEEQNITIEDRHDDVIEQQEGMNEEEEEEENDVIEEEAIIL